MEIFTVEVVYGYERDRSTGDAPTDSVILFTESNTSSPDVGVAYVGQILQCSDYLLQPDRRLWLVVRVDEYSPWFWAICVGNMGKMYLKPLDPRVSLPVPDFIIPEADNTNYDIENPVTKVLRTENPTQAIEIPTQYFEMPTFASPPPIVEYKPEEPVPTYTDPLRTPEDGIVLTGGKTANYEIFNGYVNGTDLANSIKSIQKNFSYFPRDEVSKIKSTYIQKFNRFKIDHPDFHLPKTFSHVFMTRPDLNIYQRKGVTIELTDILKNDPIYYYLNESDKELMLSLTIEFSRQHDFLPFLSNLAQSFEISDEYIKTAEVGETLTGYKIQYGRHNIESKTAGTFSINYIDDRNLSVYKLHKAWIEYISRVYRGELFPKTEYIQSKILDYPCSVYYIICGEDAETILFWSKYYGVFPTNTPSSVASWSKGSMVKLPEYSINYAYSIKEDFNPSILVEFNENSRGAFEYKKLFIPELGRCGTSFSGHPFIENVSNGSTYAFKLRFRE
jgi:hypothetical protein